MSVPARSGFLGKDWRCVHEDAIVLDAHSDLGLDLIRPGWRFDERHLPPPSPGAEGSHMDLPRMREARIDGAFFAVFVPGTITGEPAVAAAREQIAAIRRAVTMCPGDLALCTTAQAVRAAKAAGKVAVLIGVEGGHMIGASRDVLREYARDGVRYLTLTHVVNVEWADSSFDNPVHHGLAPFGREVVAELNRLGVMVDVSHVSDETFWDALAVSRAPIIASHSSCRALCSTPRNLTDEMILALARSGGWMGINFMSVYLDENGWQHFRHAREVIDRLQATIRAHEPGSDRWREQEAELQHTQARMAVFPSVSWERIVDHVDHAVALAGADHVGLGPDFYDSAMPHGMEDCTGFPKITEGLLKRGYAEADVGKILGGSLLEVMERVEAVAGGPAAT
jgi:membrane dipeptidase